MPQVTDIKDHYVEMFSRLEKVPQADEHSPLHRLREAAMSRFAELGFPTTRDEEWRFTNIAPLTQIAFEPASSFIPEGLTTLKLHRLTFGAWDCYQLVFVNGAFAAGLSTPPGNKTFTLGSLQDEQLGSAPESIEPYLAQLADREDLAFLRRAGISARASVHLAKFADYEEHAFTALNTAFLSDGAFVNIPRGQIVDKPIHIVFVSVPSEKPTMAHPRTLIVAGVNSQATIVESYVSFGKDVAFTNAVTEIVLEENAGIDHYRIQRENPQTFHVATLQVQQNRSSRFSSHSITTGGNLARNDLNAVLDGEGCECTLNGLYMATGKQLIDNHTRIDHAKPHCTSHELYKGILDDQARGVFNGKIYVHQDAQKTDAKQTNKTLLLSEDAVINTKPQLEIFADDVKCTHGATIGQLAEEAIFYLRSRGIGREDARSLLTFAFANDIIGRIKVEAIRAHLEETLLAGRQAPDRPELEEEV
jgi:Fe-S cluster assembly protein SufD